MARNKFDIDENLESPFQLSHLKRAMVYIGRHKLTMAASFFFSGIASILLLFCPKLIQQALDVALPEKNVTMLGILALIYFVLLLASTLLTTVRARLMAKVSQQIVYDIREDLFAHLQKLPFSYYDSRPAGKILVRVINYVNSVADMLSNGIINSILEIINIVFIVIFMFSTNAKLSWIIVAGLPVFLGVIWYLKPHQRRVWQEQSNKNSNYNAYLAESIDGVRVTQLFTRQKENMRIMSLLRDACRKVWMRAIVISNAVWYSADFISQGVYTMMFVAGVYWMGGGNIIEFGVIVAMGNYLSRFWQPIINLANIYNSFINNMAYLERIFETMDEPVVIDDAPNAVELPPIQGDVTFEHVTFGYEPGTFVLEDINFHVKAGQSVALVGPTGAGKTTVVNLISRFYNLDSGRILIDGEHDIAEVTIKSLRSQMGIMLQDSFLFSGTIMDNIRYGRLDATDEEVIAAAKAVRAHDFIMESEKGYQTMVSERGGRLSQGQKQLISFARTLLANPRILILDEATSSIDTKTERLLQEGIRVLLEGRTSFIIAHRLSTIKNCDTIYYVGDRSILEAGSHDELLAQKGLYYHLYMAQAEEQGLPVALSS